jgi:tRNA pseudouridine synthase 10
MNRDKKIYKLEAQKINDHFLILNILASAGTYIKEFVHSDLGRTNPSIKSLLNCYCDILQLDVKDLIFDNEEEKSIFSHF